MHISRSDTAKETISKLVHMSTKISKAEIEGELKKKKTEHLHSVEQF